MITNKALIAVGILLATTAVQAKDMCLSVNAEDDGSPSVTLSGTIVKKPAKKVFTEGRQIAGFYLKLDRPIQLKLYDEDDCYSYPYIFIGEKSAVIPGSKLTIAGKLIRAGSALVFPGVSIEISSIAARKP
jgi:hypothetical protein